MNLRENKFNGVNVEVVKKTLTKIINGKTINSIIYNDEYSNETKFWRIMKYAKKVENQFQRIALYILLQYFSEKILKELIEKNIKKDGKFWFYYRWSKTIFEMEQNTKKIKIVFLDKFGRHLKESYVLDNEFKNLIQEHSKIGGGIKIIGGKIDKTFNMSRVLNEQFESFCQKYELNESDAIDLAIGEFLLNHGKKINK